MSNLFCMHNKFPLIEGNDDGPIRELFSVKIFIEENFLSKEQCKELYDIILNESIINHPLIEEGKSSYSLEANSPFLYKVPNFEGLISILQNRVDYYSSVIGMLNSKVDPNYSWCNLQNKNSSLNFHVHRRSQLSGVIYVNVDDDSAPLKFINPNYGSFYHENKDFDEFVKTTNTPMVSYRPKIGDFLLFPSWLLHGNINNQTENRAIISFNTVVLPPGENDHGKCK